VNQSEATASEGSTPMLLFAYGTLAVAPRRSGAEQWDADAVRGRIYDLGPYPVLVDWEDPNAGWVEGYVRPVDLRELEEQLDFYEGVDEGLYRRVSLLTRSGRNVWVYVYPNPLPSHARGPLSRWEGPRAASAE
jgi:gamma-glutamylcyclotransferase (GGCT)/AIG2-like uncharacterized protein YtfP